MKHQPDGAPINWLLLALILPLLLALAYATGIHHIISRL